MDTIHKLPYIFSILAAIITGLLSYKPGAPGQDIYLKMVISMVVFYFLGLYVRGTLNKINDEITEKKEKEELERLELEALNSETGETVQQEKMGAGPTKIDYRVDDDEEFSPMTVSEVIRTMSRE